MKKFLALTTLLVVIMTIMSFIVVIHPKTKSEKHTTTSIKKLVCDCNTPPSGGKPVSNGVYIYVAQYKNSRNDTFKIKKGTVALIR